MCMYIYEYVTNTIYICACIYACTYIHIVHLYSKYAYQRIAQIYSKTVFSNSFLTIILYSRALDGHIFHKYKYKPAHTPGNQTQSGDWNGNRNTHNLSNEKV